MITIRAGSRCRRLVALAIVCCLTLGLAAERAHALIGPLAWQPPVHVDYAKYFNAIACPSESLCVAVDGSGNVVTTTDPAGGAAAWTVAHVDTSPLTGVFCASAAMCAASDKAGRLVTSTDPAGGATAWSIVEGPPETLIDGVQAALVAASCPSTSLCVAVDDGPRIFTTGSPPAGPWQIRRVPRVQCPRTACFGYGPEIGERNLDSISCPSVSLCVATDLQGDVVASTAPTGGSEAWSTYYVDAEGGTASMLPDIQVFIAAVSCPSTTLCVAIDQQGDTLLSTNPTGGAAAWHLRHRSVAWSLEGFQLVCPSTDTCIAVGSQGGTWVSEEPWRDAPWVQTNVDATPLAGTSCPTARLCVAVDELGDVVVARARELSVGDLRRELAGAWASTGPRIGAALRSGRIELPFRAPLGGHVVVRLLTSAGALAARGQYDFEAAAQRRIALTLTRAGRRLLAARRTARLQLQAVYTRAGVGALAVRGRLVLRH